jgi:hypothetical protein
LGKKKCGSGDDQVRLLKEHVDALMQLPLLARSHFIYCPERAMGHSPGLLWPHISHYANMHKLLEEGVNADAPGIYTSPERKNQYAISALYHIKEGHIQIARDLVCANTKMKRGNSLIPASERPEAILAQTREQLLNYRQIESDTTDPIGNTRKSLSGVADRHGKKDPSAKDDVAFIVTMVLGVTDLLREGKLPLVKPEWLPAR